MTECEASRLKLIWEIVLKFIKGHNETKLPKPKLKFINFVKKKKKGASPSFTVPPPPPATYSPRHRTGNVK
jgi:hypothetical protein